MLEQEVVSERDLRSKSDRTKDDVERDLVDALEQLRIANLNNASKDKDLTVSKHLILVTFWWFEVVLIYTWHWKCHHYNLVTIITSHNIVDKFICFLFNISI